jgi:hypothetical protein
MKARNHTRRYVTSTGLLMSQKQNSDPVPFEGALELAFFAIADFDPLVDGFSQQPFQLDFQDGNGSRRTFRPSALVNFKRRIAAGRRLRPLLVHIKGRAAIDADPNLHDLENAAGQKFADTMAMRYRVFSEEQIYTPFWQNAKFFRRFGNCSIPRQAAEPMEIALGAVIARHKRIHERLTIDTALRLAALSLVAQNSSEAVIEQKVLELMPCLYREIRCRTYIVDMSQLVTPQSEIRLPGVYETPFSFFA